MRGLKPVGRRFSAQKFAVAAPKRWEEAAWAFFPVASPALDALLQVKKKHTGKCFTLEVRVGRHAGALTDNDSLPSFAKACFLFNIAPTKIYLKVKRKRKSLQPGRVTKRKILLTIEKKEVSPLIIQFNRETVSRESGYFPIKPLPRYTAKINEHNRTARSQSVHPRRQSGRL